MKPTTYVTHTLRLCIFCCLGFGLPTFVAIAQPATPPRTVMWLHGRGEERQGFWNRFAADIQGNSRGRIDTLRYFERRYTFNGAYLPAGYYSPEDISFTANAIFSRLSTSGSLSPSLADSPILIGHSQGGVTAREVDRRNPSNVGGIITVGSPNYGVGLLRARQTISAGKNEIQHATDRALKEILPGPILDPVFGMSAFSFLGIEFLYREACVSNNTFLGDVWAYTNAFIAGGIGLVVGAAANIIQPLVGAIARIFTNEPLLGTTSSSPYWLPGGTDVVAWFLPGMAAALYNGLDRGFLTDAMGNIDVSVQQMAPAGTPGFSTSSLVPLLNGAVSTTPRAGVYGTAYEQSPIRLFANQMGRSVNNQNRPVSLISLDFELFNKPISIPLPVVTCRIVAPGENFLLGFVGDIPERQSFNSPNDEHLLRYFKRMQGIYRTGRDINNGFGVVTAPFQWLIDVLDIGPTSFDVANAWDQGERYLGSGLQNTYSYLIGARRYETRTVRRTIVGYRCPGFRGLLDAPRGSDCVMEMTEYDETVSYLVSTGDDGFIAQEDQKIPLRTNRVIPYEDNIEAGNPDDPVVENRRSCNHFTEGNHPAVYRRLRLLLTDDPNSPFYIP
jgi:hypothetical protein